MWESMLAAILSHVDLGAVLTKIGGTKVLDWAVKTLDFVGKTFLADIRQRRAYNPDLKAFLIQRITNEEASHPDENGIMRLMNVVKDPATWDFIKALGIEELKDLKGSILTTLVSVYHAEVETILPDLVSVFLATGKMPSLTAIEQMLKLQSEKLPAATPPAPAV